jgi:hypothetical protein
VTPVWHVGSKRDLATSSEARGDRRGSCPAAVWFAAILWCYLLGARLAILCSLSCLLAPTSVQVEIARVTGSSFFVQHVFTFAVHTYYRLFFVF